MQRRVRALALAIWFFGLFCALLFIAARARPPQELATALRLAAACKSKKLVEKLLKRGADPRRAVGTNMTALRAAALENWGAGLMLMLDTIQDGSERIDASYGVMDGLPGHVVLAISETLRKSVLLATAATAEALPPKSAPLATEPPPLAAKPPPRKSKPVPIDPPPHKSAPLAIEPPPHTSAPLAVELPPPHTSAPLAIEQPEAAPSGSRRRKVMMLNSGEVVEPEKKRSKKAPSSPGAAGQDDLSGVGLLLQAVSIVEKTTFRKGRTVYYDDQESKAIKLSDEGMDTYNRLKKKMPDMLKKGTEKVRPIFVRMLTKRVTD